MELTEARQRFGQVYGSWLKRHNLSSLCLQSWGKDAGQSGPWTAQISQLINGKLLSPKVELWVSLGALNTAIADGTVTCSIDARCEQRLQEASPLLNWDGETATAGDLFSCFIGETEFHPTMQPLQVSQADTDQAVAEARQRFAAVCKQAFDSDRMRCWSALEHCCMTVGITAAQRALVKDVLSGWLEPTTEQAMTLWLGRQCLLTQALVLLEQEAGV